MAYKKVNSTDKKEVTSIPNEPIQEEINLDQKVTVKNIAGWEVGFARIEGNGDVRITAGSSIKLTRNEIIQQVQNGNRLFIGIKGDGNHATLYIDDEATKKELGFENQIIFTEKTVKDLFEWSDIKTFEEELNDKIKTRAEKYAIVQVIKKLKLNDYQKIRRIEQYTGYNVT